MKINLVPFDNQANTSLTAQIITRSSHVELEYQINSQAAIVWPQPQQLSVYDELWRSTCLELFIADNTSSNYLEFNFTPQLYWNVYLLTDYRQGLTSVASDFQPEISSRQSNTLHQLKVQFKMPSQFQFKNCRINLTAVVESKDSVSYWAHRHPQNKPDFHDKNCFLNAPRMFNH